MSAAAAVPFDDLFEKSRHTGRARAVVSVIAAATVLAHLLVARRYGYAEDEMYFLDCARHLAAGYVDMPPLMAWLAWVVAHTLGTSLLALRFLPALAAGGLVWMTAALARALGGRGWAQGVAALAVALCPMLMMWAHMFTMNVFEPLLWTGATWCVVQIFLRDEPRWWLVVGALVGVGLLNKYSIGLWGVGLLAGLLLSPTERRWLRSGWLWAGIGLALLIFLPNLVWLVTHHFPFLKHEHYARTKYGLGHGPVLFLLVQVAVMGPVLAPVWLGGLAWLLFGEGGRRFRPLAWIFMVTIGVLLINRARDYYTMPPYPMMFAAGGVAWEAWLAGRFRWVRWAFPAAALTVGMVLAPVTLPVLPLAGYLRYLQTLAPSVPGAVRKPSDTKIPIYFQREMGWPEMTQTVAAAFNGLPEEDRERTAILVRSYQGAAAIDFYGPQYGLPKVISGEISYADWGPREYNGDSVLVVGSSEAAERQWWSDVQVLGTLGGASPASSEILLCRRPRESLQTMWPQMRIW